MSCRGKYEHDEPLSIIIVQKVVILTAHRDDGKTTTSSAMYPSLKERKTMINGRMPRLCCFFVTALPFLLLDCMKSEFKK